MFLQERSLPLEYGLCECTDPQCDDAFTICNTNFDLDLDLLSGATTAAASNGPELVLGVDAEVWSFSPSNTIDSNWLDIDETIKDEFLQRNDDFSISFWISVNPGSSSSYIFSFEVGTSRYFSLFDSSRSRAQLYYNRDTLPNADSDSAVGSRVVLSFFYDSDVFSDGLRDGEWHFVSLNINFPEAVLVVDGYEIRPTGGNSRDAFNNLQFFTDLFPDDPFYRMPAPLLSKSPDLISSIRGRIGGTERNNQFSIGGQMRQLTATDLLDTDAYDCIASCNNIISSTLSLTSFATFYNPVQRIFTFDLPTSDHDDYTDFLRSLVYQSDGFIPAETLAGGGESRIIRLQVLKSYRSIST